MSNNGEKRGISFTRNRVLLMALVVEGSVLIIALILARFLDISITPLSNNYRKDILLGTSGACLPLIVFVLILSKRAESVPFIGPLRQIILNEIRALFSQSTIIDILLISIVAAFAEEILFRGIIQIKLGLIPASIIFGFLHFITPAYFVIATLMGLYMGGLFQTYNSLLIPIQIHFVYDFGALLYLRYFASED